MLTLSVLYYAGVQACTHKYKCTHNYAHTHTVNWFRRCWTKREKLLKCLLQTNWTGVMI